MQSSQNASAELWEHTACFSGHRMKKMHFSKNVLKLAYSLLYQATREAIEHGYYRFYTGMASGVDLWAAEIIIALRRSYPKLELHCVSPFPAFLNGSTGETHYQQMLVRSRADSVCFTSPHYTKDCFCKRNQYMIDHSSLLLALVVDWNSGTGQTIHMAERAGISKVVIDMSHPAYATTHTLWTHN